jgi:hypothetical protein
MFADIIFHYFCLKRCNPKSGDSARYGTYYSFNENPLEGEIEDRAGDWADEEGTWGDDGWDDGT